ncbi:hypothetical protein JAAARDRAFT_37566 [Jaapia argillacea MUCL 33604]|uniref:Uncharacterized protein n=1 Tax=Jaapia argillacea MUCL 33604 TaxID=933084 RepID=A0A067PXG1_9AGAM|nr:hypothetical protein JAAARDRAFT_37566 [Jaapia argillacea MUCL 33604]
MCDTAELTGTIIISSSCNPSESHISIFADSNCYKADDKLTSFSREYHLASNSLKHDLSEHTAPPSLWSRSYNRLHRSYPNEPDFVSWVSEPMSLANSLSFSSSSSNDSNLDVMDEEASRPILTSYRIASFAILITFGISKIIFARYPEHHTSQAQFFLDFALLVGSLVLYYLSWIEPEGSSTPSSRWFLDPDWQHIVNSPSHEPLPFITIVLVITLVLRGVVLLSYTLIGVVVSLILVSAIFTLVLLFDLSFIWAGLGLFIIAFSVDTIWGQVIRSGDEIRLTAPYWHGITENVEAIKFSVFIWSMGVIVDLSCHVWATLSTS